MSLKQNQTQQRFSKNIEYLKLNFKLTSAFERTFLMLPWRLLSKGVVVPELDKEGESPVESLRSNFLKRSEDVVESLRTTGRLVRP